jgi:hypothetical protein
MPGPIAFWRANRLYDVFHDFGGSDYHNHQAAREHYANRLLSFEIKGEDHTMR